MPGFYFRVSDARGEHFYQVGPLTRKGKFRLAATASDEQGCEGQLGGLVYVTVAP